MYQISGKDLIYAQLESMPDAGRRELFLAWLADIAEDPHGAGTRLPGRGAPVYMAMGRLGTLTIKYLVAEQYKTVHFIGFGVLP